MAQNSFTSQIIGLSELSEPLEIGKSYEIQIIGDCVSITKQDEGDGSFTFKHKIKQQTANITKDNGQIIRVKDTKSQSQKLRGQLINIALEAQIDKEEFYDSTMIDIRHYLPDLIVYMAELKRKGI